MEWNLGLSMYWHLKVPKILHLYWGGGTMNYLRFMTIKTFMKYNPDWEIRLMLPTHPTTNITWNDPEQKYTAPCKDYLNEALELPITKSYVDLTEFGFNEQTSEVHKSDFIRLLQLSTCGGVWADMDIIFFKPMSSLYLNLPRNRNIETFYCNHNYGHSVGFLMASENNKFFKKVMEFAKSDYSPDRYQSMGATTYNKHFFTPELIELLGPSMNMSMDVVYAHDATYFPELLTNKPPRFTNESIGVHWYGASPLWKNFLVQTDGGLNNLPDTIIGNVIKSIEL
jgi:hypothetical protein